MTVPSESGPSEPAPAVGRRHRITSPHTGAQPHVRRTPREEIDLATGVGEVYIRSLMRAQLRTALMLLAVLVCTLGALPLAFAFVDGLAATRLGDIPLPWVVLGVGAYPVLFALGWVYVRRAERAERAFARLVDPPNPDQ